MVGPRFPWVPQPYEWLGQTGGWPFGGFGRGGYGSLKGREALMGYIQRKNVLLNI